MAEEAFISGLNDDFFDRSESSAPITSKYRHKCVVNFGLTFGLGIQWSIPNNRHGPEVILARNPVLESLDKVKPQITGYSNRWLQSSPHPATNPAKVSHHHSPQEQF